MQELLRTILCISQFSEIELQPDQVGVSYPGPASCRSLSIEASLRFVTGTYANFCAIPSEMPAFLPITIPTLPPRLSWPFRKIGRPLLGLSQHLHAS